MVSDLNLDFDFISFNKSNNNKTGIRTQISGSRVDCAKFFFKIAQAGEANLGSFSLRLFSLSSSALDHSATGPPSLQKTELIFEFILSLV